MKIDADFDGFVESEASETLDATGLVQQQYARYSKSTRAIEYRQTLARASPGVLRQKTEKLVSGALTPVRELEVRPVQKQAPGCMLTGPAKGMPDQIVTPCDTDAIKAQIKSALDQGIKCLLRGSVDDVTRLMQLRAMIDTFDVSCFRNQGYVASVDISRPNGRIPFNYNVDLPTCSAPYQAGTMFHELMHLITGGHDDALDALLESSTNVGPEQYTYTDRMRSCERLCFGTLTTRCACAACFDSKACDERCSSYGSCIKRTPNPDGGAAIAVMSEAVGAVCQSNADPTMGEIYQTMAACRSACGSGMSCNSKSLSCDPTCQ